MRVLLDEGFPDPPGFDPSDLDALFDVTALRNHDAALVGNRTPDWFLYLVAHQADFDGLVTRDWRQSAQAAEMWVATRTDISIITWRNPQDDPVVEWGQLLAYMPMLRRLREQHGPSIFFLPRPSLNATQHVERASAEIAKLCRDLGVSRAQLTREARDVAREWLDEQGLLNRYADTLGLAE